MPNAAHLKILIEHGREWNAWRLANPDIAPDLSGADLSNREFHRDMNFRFANFAGCNLSSAYVPNANFYDANLTRANLASLISNFSHLLTRAE